MKGCLSLAMAPRAIVEMSFRSPVDAQARMSWCLSPDQQQPYKGEIPSMQELYEERCSRFTFPVLRIIVKINAKLSNVKLLICWGVAFTFVWTSRGSTKNALRLGKQPTHFDVGADNRTKMRRSPVCPVLGLHPSELRRVRTYEAVDL